MGAGEVLDLRGVSLFVRVLGEQTDARPLLMVHGGPDWDHSYFLPYTEPLAAVRKLILPDLRGCGRSTRFGDSKFYHVSLAAKDLLNLLDHFEIFKADVLGFSFGGRVAIELAMLAPDRVGSLVLASASPYQDFSVELDEWDEYRARCTRQLRQARESLFAQPEIDDEVRSRELAHLTAALDIYCLDSLSAYRSEVLDKICFSGEWMHAWREGVQFAPLDLGVEIIPRDIPVLIFHGEKDMRFPVSAAHRFHATWPHSALELLPHTGHMAHIEAPQDWCSAVDSFLRATSQFRSCHR